ncbi:MAG: flavodoxin [Erysipelotrichaceae bacterium]
MTKPILIAYFSRADKNYVNGGIANLTIGNTEAVALKLHEMTESHLFKINPAQKYSVDYQICTEEAQREFRANARPELKETLDSIEAYETILLAYPNWWGTMPMPVWTFLEQHDFAGKNILPLCTHEGSGMGKSENDIRKLCPGANVLKGLAIKGSNVKNIDSALSEWLSKSL